MTIYPAVTVTLRLGSGEGRENLRGKKIDGGVEGKFFLHLFG